MWKKLCKWPQCVDPLVCCCYSAVVMFRLRPAQPADFLCCTACEDLLEVSFVSRHRPYLTDSRQAPMKDTERVRRKKKKSLFSFFCLVNILSGDTMIELFLTTVFFFLRKFTISVPEINFQIYCSLLHYVQTAVTISITFSLHL